MIPCLACGDCLDDCLDYSHTGPSCRCDMMSLHASWTWAKSAASQATRTFQALTFRIRLEIQPERISAHVHGPAPLEYVVHSMASGSISAMLVGGGPVARPVRMRDIDLDDVVRERAVSLVLGS